MSVCIWRREWITQQGCHRARFLQIHRTQYGLFLSQKLIVIVNSLFLPKKVFLPIENAFLMLLAITVCRFQFIITKTSTSLYRWLTLMDENLTTFRPWHLIGPCLTLKWLSLATKGWCSWPRKQPTPEKSFQHVRSFSFLNYLPEHFTFLYFANLPLSLLSCEDFHLLDMKRALGTLSVTSKIIGYKHSYFAKENIQFEVSPMLHLFSKLSLVPCSNVLGKTKHFRDLFTGKGSPRDREEHARGLWWQKDRMCSFRDSLLRFYVLWLFCKLTNACLSF